jgi:hypothetical protein
VLIVFDHSVSMEHKGDGPTSRERAIHEAVKLVDSLGPEDTVNVLLMEPNLNQCFVSFSKDTDAAKRFLNQLQPGLGRADVNQANAVAARLFAQTSPRPEIYYLSDFARKKWASVNFTMLPPTVKLFFVDAGPARRDNRAILDARSSQTELLAGDTVPLAVTIGNFAAEPFNGRVTVTLDERFSFDQEVSIAPWSQEKVTVPVSVGGPGVHRCEVRLPADALEYDNHFFLTLAVQEKEEVLIVSDEPDRRKSGAYYLQTALNPFANEAGSLLPRLISSGELSPARLAGVQKIFFTQINRLSSEACNAVAKSVFQGAGLVYFLDGPADADNLAVLEKITGPGTVPPKGRSIVYFAVTGTPDGGRNDLSLKNQFTALGRVATLTGVIPTSDEAKSPSAGETSTFNRAVATADEGVSAFDEAVATTVEAAATDVEAATTGDK